jgi:hypothetical protein
MRRPTGQTVDEVLHGRSVRWFFELRMEHFKIEIIKSLFCADDCMLWWVLADFAELFWTLNII